MIRFLLVLLAAIPLSACAITHDAYAPRSAFSLDQDIAELHAQYESATSIADYYKNPPETREKRDALIVGRLTLYDLEYLRFISQFRLSRAQQNEAFDATALGLGLATTLSAGARAKTVLGALTTALTGARTSYEKNFYDDKTTTALVSQMSAERKLALIPILSGLQADIGDYPLAKAIVDLNIYQFAGTIDGALQGVQKDAADKDAKASARIDQYRSHSFAPDDSSDRIMKWLYPGYQSFDADGIAHDSAGAVVDLVTRNYQNLRSEFAKLGLDGIALEAFLNTKGLAADRATAIKDLNIP